MPFDSTKPLREGVDALGDAVIKADASRNETDNRVAAMDLATRRAQRERELQLRTGDVAAHIATEEGNLQVDLIKLRENAGPGAAGHEDAVNERIGKFRDTVTDYIGNDPELAARFADNIAVAGANARVGEATWAAAARAKKSATDIGVLGDALSNNIRTAITNGTLTDKTIPDAEALYARAVDAKPIPEDAKAAMKRDAHVAFKVAAAEGAIDTDPHGMLTKIDQGALDDIPDATRDALRSRARVAADRLDNEAEQGANAAAAAARAVEGNLIEDVTKGVIVDPAALQAAYARASASKKPEDIRLAHDLLIASARNAVTAKYDASTNEERLSVLHEIEGKKDWQKDEQLVATHDQLATLIGRDDHAASQDPLPLYTRQTGQALAPLNLADPKAMQKRFAQGDLAGERFNKPPTHLTEAEAGEMRQQYNSASPSGKADLLFTFGQYGSPRARQLMRQLSPNKPPLALLSELAASRDGAVKLLVNEALDGSAQPVKDGLIAHIEARARTEMGPALARLPGDRRSAVVQIAAWIYAHRSAQGGKPGGFDNALARDSLEAALGGAGGKGGIGTRNGEKVVLPQLWDQRQFDSLLTLASPEQIRRSANGTPKWADRDLHLAEFRGLVPVLINDTGTQALYAFRSRGGSGYVKTERGDDYVVDLRQLAGTVVHDRRPFSPANLARYGYQRR
jgi:hypothetical protein